MPSIKTTAASIPAQAAVMRERPEVWLVARGEELVAELEAQRIDLPWLYGRVIRRPGFWPLQLLFDREQQLARRVHRNPAAWVSAYRRVRREVRLLHPDGCVVRDFILHIDGNRARWRCVHRESTNWLDAQLAATKPRPAAPERRAGWLLSALIGATLATLVLPAQAVARGMRHQQSSNWAGYAVTANKPFRSVSGSWVQPAADCIQQQSTYAAFWVGLGGFKQGSQKLEQIGTEANCSASGTANAYAWYELVPHAPARIRLPIRPGDRIAAQASLQGDLVRLKIRDLTSRRTFAKTIVFANPDASSAEWIAEAPSQCISRGHCQPLPLTDFNTVQFTSARATSTAGHAGTITNAAFSSTELTLSDDAGQSGPTLPPGALPPGAPGGTYPGATTSSTDGAKPTDPAHHGADFSVDFTGTPTTTTTTPTTTTPSTTTTPTAPTGATTTTPISNDVFRQAPLKWGVTS